MENENIRTAQVVDREFVSGFALTGEYVKNLDNKTFEVVGQRSELVPDIDHPETRKEKLILTVVMSDGTKLDYFPNKTSQKVLIGRRGYKLNDWIGYKGQFYTASQKVGPLMKDVIYIDEQYSYEEAV